MEGGKCPSCWRNTKDLAGVDLSRTKVRLHEDDRLPMVCSGCGLAASRQRVVKASQTVGGEGFLTKVILLLTGRFGALMSHEVRGARHELSIALPLCEPCDRKPAPEPTYVDYDRRTMTFLVHRTFAEALPDLVAAR